MSKTVRLVVELTCTDEAEPGDVADELFGLLVDTDTDDMNGVESIDMVDVWSGL